MHLVLIGWFGCLQESLHFLGRYVKTLYINCLVNQSINCFLGDMWRPSTSMVLQSFLASPQGCEGAPPRFH